MKHSKLVASVAIFAGSLAAHAYAESTKAGGTQDMMKMMDANSDDKVTHQEHAACAARMFAKMDADRDGIVTATEMDAGHERVTGKAAAKGELSTAEKIKVIDADGDGKLTAAEHVSGSQMMFERMDADRDGFLTAAEIAAGHAKLMSKQ
jgi:Ca2+-binding EF-hand superfamily protein